MLTEELIHIQLEQLIRSGEFYKAIDFEDIQQIKKPDAYRRKSTSSIFHR